MRNVETAKMGHWLGCHATIDANLRFVNNTYSYVRITLLCVDYKKLKVKYFFFQFVFSTLGTRSFRDRI